MVSEKDDADSSGRNPSQVGENGTACAKKRAIYSRVFIIARIAEQQIGLPGCG